MYLFLKDVFEEQSETTLPSSSTDSAFDQKLTTTNASRRKMSLFRSQGVASISSSSSQAKLQSFGSRLVTLEFLHSLVGVLACPSDVAVSEGFCKGLASNFEEACKGCKAEIITSFTSPKATDGYSFHVNPRFVYSCKSNGMAYKKGTSFIADMNLPKTISTSAFTSKLSTLANSCETALEHHLKSVRRIVKAEYIKSGECKCVNNVIDITVSYDGTWHKRGHTSHNGVGIAIDLRTVFVVDFEVISNFVSLVNVVLSLRKKIMTSSGRTISKIVTRILMVVAT